MISNKVQGKIKKMSPEQRKVFREVCKSMDKVRALIDKISPMIWPCFTDDEITRQRMATLRELRRKLESVYSALNIHYRKLLK